jgi:hypothetical protein
MTKVILAHNTFDAEILVDVMSEMKKRGAPTIRGFWNFDGDFQAIEGCHRVRAAAALGLTPELEALDKDTLRVDVEDLDYEDGSDLTCATIETIGDWENDVIVFED